MAPACERVRIGETERKREKERERERKREKERERERKREKERERERKREKERERERKREKERERERKEERERKREREILLGGKNKPCSFCYDCFFLHSVEPIPSILPHTKPPRPCPKKQTNN